MAKEEESTAAGGSEQCTATAADTQLRQIHVHTTWMSLSLVWSKLVHPEILHRKPEVPLSSAQVSVDGQRVRLQQLEAEAKRPKEEAKKLAEEMAMQNAALLYGEGGNVEDWKKKYLATSNQLQQVRHELQELRTQTQKQKKVLMKELGTDESIQQAMAVADDPLAVQWKGRAAQIAQLQRQLKDFKASSCTNGGTPTAQVQESAATLAPAVAAAAKNKAVAQAADKRREEFDRLQEEVEKLRQEQTECKRKRDALKSRAGLLESQLRDLKAHVQFLLRKSDDDDALVSMLQKQLGREDAEFQEDAGSDAALRQQNAELQAQLERQAQIVLQLRQKALAASCENGSVPLGPKSVEASVTERQLLERVRFLEAENAKQAQQVQLLKAREAVGGSFNESSSSFRDHFRDAVDVADR
ncbi:CCDC13 [Symbiodinium sp. CCMP2592]|nr:CCDC13 [Symbiodinium sp. CCMP2592]